MASGYAAFVAFNAGNLLSVAMRARRLFPESKLIVVADDDWQTEEKTGKNTGLKAAEEAPGALAVGLPCLPSGASPARLI